MVDYSQKPIVRQGTKSEERPVPIIYKGSNIVSGGEAESLFSSMKREASSKGISINDLPPTTAEEIKKRAVHGQVSGGVSSSVLFSSFFSPFRTPQSIETPTKRQDLNQWYRYWVLTDPLVGMAIQLHAEFPLSDFDLDHPDPTVREFFNDQKEKLNLLEFLHYMAMEYNIVGEAFPFGFLDDPKQPAQWTRFILLDPDFVNIKTHRLVQGNRPYTISIIPDRNLKHIISKGENDQNVGKLYKQLPQDFVEAVRAGREISLPNIQVSHFKRVVNVHSERGESIISRVRNWLMYRDKLISGQYATVDRHISPKEFYMLGESNAPADSIELEAFAQALQAQWTNPNQAIIWHHALKVQWEGAEGKILNIGKELDFVERQILIGLGISKALILGEGPGYSAATIAYQALISRYLTFRKLMEKWILKSVFEPLCHIHRIYKSTPASLVARFRIQGKKEPWLPKIIWHKGELSNDMQRIDMLMRMYKDKLVSGDTVLRSTNLDPAIENRNMVDEAVRLKKRDQEIQNAVGDELSEPSVELPGSEKGVAAPAGSALPDLLPSIKEGVPTPSGGELIPEEAGAAAGGEILPELAPGPGRPPEGEEVGPTIPEGERAPLGERP